MKRTLNVKKSSFLKLFSILSLLVLFLPNQALATSEYTPPVNDKELKCLAKNIFFEARNTDVLEMIRIASVVQNRINSGKYPTTPCQVIQQRKQFSWTSSPKNNIQRIVKLIKKDKKELAAWLLAKDVAKLSLEHKLKDITGNSIAYHTASMNKPKSSFWKHMHFSVASSYHVYYTGS
jgi:spore germination cell wall hydrolase CwlJ-like protein